MLKFHLADFYNTQDEQHHYSDPKKHGKNQQNLRFNNCFRILLACYFHGRVDLMNNRWVSRRRV